MSLRKEKLIKHQEGDGQLSWQGGAMFPVRYILDTWSETIATGSGTTAEMVRHDGFLWWDGGFTPGPKCLLETENQDFQITLNEFRSQRARFYCLG